MAIMATPLRAENQPPKSRETATEVGIMNKTEVTKPESLRMWRSFQLRKNRALAVDRGRGLEPPLFLLGQSLQPLVRFSHNVDEELGAANIHW